MDKIYERTMLFDFYGELLTEHQRSIYEDALYNDLSLGEIAGERGISRQGVHDLVKRCQKALEGYESRLHLVGRFLSIREKVREMEALLEGAELTGENQEELLRQFRELSGSILEVL